MTDKFVPHPKLLPVKKHLDLLHIFKHNGVSPTNSVTVTQSRRLCELTISGLAGLIINGEIRIKQTSVVSVPCTNPGRLCNRPSRLK